MTSHGRRRVVITGLGALTPLGKTVDEFWAAAVSGASGVRPFQDLDPSNYPCHVVGEVQDFEPEDYMDRRAARRMARFSQFAVAVARQAVDAAGLDLDAIDRTRAGIVLGNGGGGYPNVEQAVQTMDTRGGMKIDPLYVAKWLPNMAAANVTIQLGLRGYTNTVVTACASGTQAIGEATEVIRRGSADVMLAGGTEAGICELGLAGFAAMRALTTSFNGEPERASRPFDRDRDGFVPAEGAGMVTLESLEHAQARGATPLAEVIGYGVSADATYLVAPSDGGEGAAHAMRLAIEDAAIAPEEIDYISAHATATAVGDVAETKAIKTVFGEHAYRTPVTSLKSQIGHLLGGSGGVEAVATVQTLLTGRIAPTINLEHPADECDLDYVPLTSRSVDARIAMKNSFGFGGQNAVLILRRFQD
ncbi:MAG: beta-ketoacyl-ACP synthase II [Chloroflexi bacterium]|nr:beta-ketoacyl-ACP synthase II [Chloroflexota bacterium]MDA1146738.1 beta-ketoacyl-ACP synthase II [Chloroflexota bacterium]MQC82893.1 beta-ketoacyl-[acyl-carrier-protein] synthase II [Chloroflexota bacterium]